MKFYTFGDKEKPAIMLLPGPCCHWTIFNDVIPLLKEKFYVIAASYDGFDETEDNIYPSMTAEIEKIEAYIQDNFDGHICCVYGCSEGGAFAACLAQRQNVHINHVIIGSSFFATAGKIKAAIQSKVVAGAVYKVIQTGKLPDVAANFIDKLEADSPGITDKLTDAFLHSPIVKTVQKQSIYNQFYTYLTTPIANHIDVPDTAIHVFYALKMGEKYDERYRTLFAHPDIRTQDMQHEVFFFCHPEDWAREVADCCGMA